MTLKKIQLRRLGGDMDDNNKDNRVFYTGDMPEHLQKKMDSRIKDVTEKMITLREEDEPGFFYFGILMAGFAGALKDYITDDAPIEVKKYAAKKLVYYFQKNMDSLIEEWENQHKANDD